MSSPVMADPIIGRTLGDFVIREKLGEGGFGVVYRSEQLTLAREAVVKVLHAKHRANEEVIERFMREARLASRLEHPYTAHVYAFGAEADGLLWIAMEFVRGTPLDTVLKTQGPMPLERLVPLLDKICEVIHTAHEHGIIHRDIKPANVMAISRAGRLLPKLLDFGIAKGLNTETARASETAEQINAAVDPFLTQEDIDARITEDEEVSSTMSNKKFKQTGAIGSPRYMAPEQWEGSASAGARSDIYALGVMTYELLTGEPPFKGAGYALFYQHSAKAVPPLGAAFPPALDQVMTKVMAKLPEDRYATALEYAAAFREAAGFTEKRVNLPQLDEQLRDSLLAGAPQPLAEAIANFGAARNTHQARDQIMEVSRVSAHYIGLLALACRKQVGSGAQYDSQAVTETFQRLFKQSLSKEQWLDLAQELCKPFIHQRDAYPMPELVSLFYDRNGEPTGFHQRLLKIRETMARSVGATEEHLIKTLMECLPQFAELLRELSFLSDYHLVVPRGDHTEQWMSAAKARGTGVVMSMNQLVESDKPILADAQGRAVLALWPLVQIAQPSPGAPEEMFFFDGRGRNGAKLVALPSGFERQDEELAEWFRKNFGVGQDNEDRAAQERAPYLGLASFTPNDADLFFGREREAEAFLNRMRVQPLLAVVGASGAGKSSFVQAGVIPGLSEDWKPITLRPGPAPLAALKAQLEKRGIKVPELRPALEHDPDSLGAALRKAAEEASETIVLVIDQFEELFTLCLDQSERLLYSEAIARTARAAEDPVRVIITLRDDFLMRAEQMPWLRARLAQGLQLLATPAVPDLMRILIEPAKHAGYEFEDKELPVEIVKSVADLSGALPLVAFTASKLWELRDRQFKLLRRKTYEAMGGVGGALAQHAEEMMSQMTPEEQRLVREVFRHLVTSEGTRAILTRKELDQVLGGGRHAEAVVEKLIGARLLIASEGEGGAEKIEVIHEALLSAWPRLVKWRLEDAEGARLRDQLRAAARQWHERGRVKGLLWREEALREYQIWRARYEGKLTDIEEAFGSASLGEAVRGRRTRQIALVSALSVLLMGIIVLAFMYSRTQNALELAEDNSLKAKRILLKYYEEEGRQELLKGNGEAAAVFLSEAYDGGRDTPSLRFLLARSLQRLDAQLLARSSRPVGDQYSSFEGHTGNVYAARFSPDGSRIVTASEDGGANLCDASSGKPIASLKGHTGIVRSAQFSPDGKRIVTAGADNGAKVWDGETGRLLASLEGHSGSVEYAEFSPDGKRIVTASADGSAKIWDAQSGRLLISLEGHAGGVGSARFSPDGKRVITASKDNSAKAWDAETGRQIFSLNGHAGIVYSARFSPDGKRIATASEDNSARIWDGETGRLIASLSHKGSVNSAVFSPDGSRIVTACSDNTARVWDAENGKSIAILEGHIGIVGSAEFSPDGNRIATAGADSTAKVWDAETGKLFVSFKGHNGAVNYAEFSRDGSRLVTASADKTAMVWDARLEERSREVVAELVKRNIPLRLDQGRLMPAEK